LRKKIPKLMGITTKKKEFAREKDRGTKNKND